MNDSGRAAEILRRHVKGTMSKHFLLPGMPLKGFARLRTFVCQTVGGVRFSGSK
jgi:hypothetical protein